MIYYGNCRRKRTVSRPPSLRLTVVLGILALVLTACPAPEPEVDEPVEGLPDVPQAYTSLYAEGVEPAAEAVDGEATVTVGPPDGLNRSFAFLVHNGTGEPISDVSVSGAAVDADGNDIDSGSSLGVEPHVVEPGRVAFGSVFIGADLPEGARLVAPAIDYTEGLRDVEIRVQLNIEAIDWIGNDLTGTVINPHNVVVGGPASVRAVCLEEGGMPTTVMSSFTDRDTIEPEGSSTFTIEPSVSLNCAGILAAASGRVRD